MLRYASVYIIIITYTCSECAIFYYTSIIMRIIC